MLNKTRPDCEYFYTSFYIEDNRNNTIKVLLSMNITDSKFYIYSLKGILRERTNFQNLTQMFGRVRQVSNNGQIFIFKKTLSFNLNIMLMTNKDGLNHIKTINLQEAVQHYLKNDECPNIEELNTAVNTGEF